ncbi:hypothetical protein SKAU_G00180890 [Synaphobranchus kaupii]|uniref:Uncharacterized protein n=1 Tax=Synaphobranchus kaupii TaxID=118154 RepID=A0A9Q1FMA2_SYNKA|nr:hypothetical protein SKAU_G00180890 [Synaphobranchus kaupii]
MAAVFTSTINYRSDTNPGQIPPVPVPPHVFPHPVITPLSGGRGYSGTGRGSLAAPPNGSPNRVPPRAATSNRPTRKATGIQSNWAAADELLAGRTLRARAGDVLFNGATDKTILRPPPRSGGQRRTAESELRLRCLNEDRPAAFVTAPPLGGVLLPPSLARHVLHIRTGRLCRSFCRSPEPLCGRAVRKAVGRTDASRGKFPPLGPTPCEVI